MDTKKKCSDCKKVKNIICFSKDKSSIGGYSYRCKECAKEHYSKWRASDPTRYKKYTRNNMLKSKYGINEEWYENKLTEQNNRCAICNELSKDLWKGLSCSFAVDHNHVTKQPRGLLCKKCNSAIGQLHDNVLLLQKAIEYLNKYN